MKILFMEAHTDKAKELQSFISNNYPQLLTEKNPEVIFVAGGDGTMIRAIHKEISRNIPFFGIGKGTLNFLMNEVSNIEEIINSDFNSVNFGIEETKCVEVTIVKKNGEVFKYQSVNEVVLGGTVMGYHTFSFSTEDMAFNNHLLKSEKFVVSTPLGSTAYHYNNEGIIIPDLSYPIYGITTGVGPKDEKLNLFVKEQKIELEINFTRDICYVFVDGLNKIEFEIGDKVILTPGQIVRLAFIDKKGFQIKRLNRSHC